jgi:hypothetical protein
VTGRYGTMNVIYIIYLSTLCIKTVGKWGRGDVIATQVKNFAVDKL